MSRLIFIDVEWYWLVILLVSLTVGRYLMLAGLAWLVCYKPGLRSLQRFRIQQRSPAARQVRHELMYSLSTMAIFSLVGCTVCWLYRHGYTQLYTDPLLYGWWYLPLSLLLLVVIHDTYFYWTHRLLHTRWLLKHVHAVHHRSVTPTPWAAYAFHPAEALLESFIIFPMVLFIPMYLGVFFFFTFLVLAMNVMGHLGYEFVPERFRNGSVGKQLTSSTHHNLHHQKANRNFAYYFTCWDVMMGTLWKERKPARRRIPEGTDSSQTPCTAPDAN